MFGWLGDGAGVANGMLALLVALLACSAANLQSPAALKCRHNTSCQYINHSRIYDNGFMYNSYYYKVEGHRTLIQIQDTTVRIDCDGAGILESPAMPRAETAVSLTHLMLMNCPLPAATSLVDTLARLNVVMHKERLSLSLYYLKVASTLTPKFFAGLEHLRDLDILAVASHVSSERGFLVPLLSLKTVTIINVIVPAGVLDALPPSLKYLKLENADVRRLPDATKSLVNLSNLIIFNKSPLDAGAVPPGLLSLDLQSPATTLRLDTVPALELLSVYNWTELLPPPLARCDKLQALYLTAPAMLALPQGWLENCSRLEELVIENARNLTSLPPTMLPSSLTLLALRQGALESLPEGLLDSAFDLRVLELNGNRLRDVPGMLLAGSILLESLKKITLSSNDLDDGVLLVLRKVMRKSQIELDLSHNPRIRDVCGLFSFSVVRYASSLTNLLLRGTGVTHICQGWRDNMPHLEMLDLRDTNITKLSIEDLLFRQDGRIRLYLQGAPVAAVWGTREEFNEAKSARHSYTTVDFDIAFECDCRMYWVRRALDLPALYNIHQLRCVSGGRLRVVPPEDLVCARREACVAAALPDTCTCFVRPDDNPDHDDWLVHVRCENASLDRVPRLPASPGRLYELLLANNRITHLDPDDLQDNIEGLDLRNNSLLRVSEETASKLSNVGGVLQLAGNPLACDCSAAPLLRALHGRTPGTTDLHTSATCHNGSKLSQAPIKDCPQPAPPPNVSLVAWLASTLVVVLALALAATAWLASRERRFFARAVLHRWGFVWRAAEPVEDGARRYDAFLTFSHKDEGVALELLAQLEPPYRLCVHHRDWTPGYFISEQVVESVRESRRTVALVSQHFLQSSWALAELREAHTAAMLDARPRLIVVLLEEPHALQMDAQLRRYVTTHTYLRWRDPYFWEKLKLALPPPRPGPPPPEPAPQLVLPLPPELPAELLPLRNLAI